MAYQTKCAIIIVKYNNRCSLIGFLHEAQNFIVKFGS